MIDTFDRLGRHVGGAASPAHVLLSREARRRLRPRPTWRRRLRVAAVAANLLRWTCISVAVLVIGGASVASVFGYHLMLVTGGSMVPRFSPGDAVVVRASGAHGVRVGNVITFKPLGASELKTHRVTAIRHIDGRTWFQTKGDANDSPDPNLAPAASVYGRELLTIPKAGPELFLALTALGKLALLGYPILFVIVQQGANAIALSRVVRKLPDELSDEDLGIPSEWSFVG